MRLGVIPAGGTLLLLLMLLRLLLMVLLLRRVVLILILMLMLMLMLVVGVSVGRGRCLRGCSRGGGCIRAAAASGVGLRRPPAGRHATAGGRRGRLREDVKERRCRAQAEASATRGAVLDGQQHQARQTMWTRDDCMAGSRGWCSMHGGARNRGCAVNRCITEGLPRTGENKVGCVRFQTARAREKADQPNYSRSTATRKVCCEHGHVAQWQEARHQQKDT